MDPVELVHLIQIYFVFQTRYSQAICLRRICCSKDTLMKFPERCMKTSPPEDNLPVCHRSYNPGNQPGQELITNYNKTVETPSNRKKSTMPFIVTYKPLNILNKHKRLLQLLEDFKPIQGSHTPFWERGRGPLNWEN